ncbi:MAG: gluconolaconase [Luteitalea sp.]|nr:gluconolaconase [Luteitalea sp.]
MSTARITSIHPGSAIEGGRITLHGEQFEVTAARLPEVQVAGRAARIVLAAPDRLSIVVPTGIGEGGPVAVDIDGAPAGEAAFIGIAAPFATGLHQVDNPAFDLEGNLYVTYSGTRGQQVPVSVFRVRPDGTRASFSSAIVNPTSMAIDLEGRIYVSSRFEGTVYRLVEDGMAEPFATDLGVPCGLAFAADGALYVGDRSGTIFKVDPSGRATTFTSLPASIAAFHLAFGPDGSLYVTGPTLAPYDPVYRIDRDGGVSVYSQAFGRPQGLAFDATGTLFVVEALAGASGLYRVPSDGPAQLVLDGPGLVGVAFGPNGSLVVCTNHTAYRLPGLAASDT